MIRRFKFEGDIPEELECVPMGVRRKLDRAGIKIGLGQWRALGKGERLAICHLPVNLEEECEAMRLFVAEAIKRVDGVSPTILSDSQRRLADPPDEVPALLATRAQQLGFTLSETEWAKFDADERYTLIKLGCAETPSHNLRSALAEFFAARFIGVSEPQK